MRKPSLERIENLENQEKAIEVEKVLIELKADISEEMRKITRSGKFVGGANKFLILGREEYKLLWNNVRNRIFADVADMPFQLDRPVFSFWGMDVVVLPTVESFIKIAADKL